MFKQLLKKKIAVAGLSIICILFLLAIFAPLIAPNNPYEQHLNLRIHGPTLKYPLGCDYLGRCVLSRIIYGARFSLHIAIPVVGIQVFIGVMLGMFAGYYGGLIDVVIMRVVDSVMAFPAMVLAIVFAGVFGPGIQGIAFALSIVGWTNFARIIRGNTLSLKEKEFVEGAKAMGFSNLYIITRHILPNAIAPVIVLATLSTGFVILIVSAFSFLGLGAQPPSADWGMMLNEGRAYMRSAPHLTIFPGIAIMITILAFNFLGDSLRDVMDPRRKTDLL